MIIINVFNLSDVGPLKECTRKGNYTISVNFGEFPSNSAESNNILILTYNFAFIFSEIPITHPPVVAVSS